MIGNWIEKGVLFGLSAIAIIDGFRIVFQQSTVFGSFQAGGYLVLLGSLIGVLTVYNWLKGNLGSVRTGDRGSEKGKIPKQVVLCLLILAGSSLLMPWLGYMLSTIFFFFAYFRLLGGYRWLRALLLSTSLSVLFAYLLVMAGMMLPQGVIPWP